MYCMCNLAKGFVEWGMDRWKRFTAIDVAAFKVCLASVGVLFGVYFAKPLKKWRPILWLIAVASYAWVIWRLLSDE